MMNIFSFRRLPELSFWQRLIHVFVTFGLVLVVAELLFMEQTDLWLVQLIIAIFGAVLGSVVFTLLEHAFFKMSAKRKRGGIKNRQV
jgi:multisubunit Na+/H+ antiporter MnhG subunit